MNRSLALLSLCLVAFAVPSAAASTDPYVFDPGFRGGVAAVDRFGGSNGDNRDNHGSKVVKLADGSVVVAALVQPIGASGDQANGFFNIGLVRYAAAGAKLAWSNVDAAYTDASHDYVVVPNNANAIYSAIDDIQEFAGSLYVLVDRTFAGGDVDAYLLRFGLDGSFSDSIAAFGSSASEHGAGMAFWQDGADGPFKIMIVASTEAGGEPHIQLSRFTLQPSPVRDTGTFGSAGFVDLHVSDCTFIVNGLPQGGNCESSANAMAAMFPPTNLGGDLPVLFIAGDHAYHPLVGEASRDVMVMKIDTNGALDENFGNTPQGGVTRIAFNDASSASQDDFAQGIVVDSRIDLPQPPWSVNAGGAPAQPQLSFVQYVYIAASVAQGCGSGVGVAQIDAVSGSSHYFHFGGNNQACQIGFYTSDNPAALALDGHRLAIAGEHSNLFAFDPFLAIVDAANGTLDDLRQQPILDGAGARIGNGGFNGLVDGGNGRFSAVGEVKDAAHNQKYMVVSARLASDRIFADGVDG